MSSYRFLLSPRWLLLTLLALVLIPAMAELGFWQYHRHEARVERNHEISDAMDREPVPVGEVTAPGRQVRDGDVYRRVTATGRYDTAHELVARQRTAADEATIGYHVITPLVLDDGTAVLVNRGWVAPGAELKTYPKVPEPPSGEVTVTGRLRPDETTSNSGIKDHKGLPDRQIMLINSAKVAERGDLPYRLVGGYLELTDTSPRPSGTQPEPVPEPDFSGIGTHFAYAVQWWLFAAMVPVGWVILARRERQELLGKKKKKSGPPPRPGGPRPPAAGPAPADGRPAQRVGER
ncbi:SURF1 family protein [Streptomyces capparidis]